MRLTVLYLYDVGEDSGVVVLDEVFESCGVIDTRSGECFLSS